MSLQETYDELKASSSLTITASTGELKSLYVMLFRKHQEYCKQMEAIGFLGDNLRDTTIGAKYHGDGTATYTLRKRRQPKQYTIIRQELPDEPQVTSLRADMGSYQEGTIRHGSTDKSAQEYAEDSDPLCAQREDDGSSTDARHWRAD